MNNTNLTDFKGDLAPATKNVPAITNTKPVAATAVFLRNVVAGCLLTNEMRGRQHN